MDPLALARLQFAATTVFHYIFVPLTLGLSIIVAVMQTQYYRTGDENYKRMTKFWGKLFLINFAMGVVTGIVQEFQFGMAWSEYSRFVGDVFGAPLAIEALMAFFVESTFLGLWIFGWDRLPKFAHLASIWLVAIASNVSALWILIANSFMQNPVGYTLNNGRAEMSDFGALITNPNIFTQFPHVVTAGFVTGAFFVIAISAYRLLRVTEENDRIMFRRSMNIGLVFGLASVVMTMSVGHLQGQQMADLQPMKLAAAEGLWENEDPAGLSFFQIGDEADREAIINVRIPSLLSFLTYNTPNGEVQGINNLQAQYEEIYGPGNYIPPFIWLLYWSFRAMVGFGVLMSLIAMYGLWLSFRGKLWDTKWLLALLPFTIVLPYIANLTGWILTEIGRQPWIVQGLMRTEDGLSPNMTATTMTISLVGFVVVYGVLAIADIYLLQKYARGGDTDGTIIPQPTGEDAELNLKGAY